MDTHDPPSAGDLLIPIPHDGTPWVPQGLGYDAAGDALVHSMYDHGDQERGLIAVQPVGGGAVAYARVLGNAHYGGIAVAGDDVYVSGNGAKGEPGTFVQRYSLAALRAADGAVVRPLQRHATASGSTVTVDGGHLYTGRYRNGVSGRIHAHRLEPDGSLPPPDTEWTPVAEWVSPPNLQGLVRDGDVFWVVRSHGTRRRSRLYRFDTTTGEYRTAARLGVLSQGVVIRRGRLVITSESGSAPYRGRVRDSTPPWRAGLVRPPVLPQHLVQEVPVPEPPRPGR